MWTVIICIALAVSISICVSYTEWGYIDMDSVLFDVYIGVLLGAGIGALIAVIIPSKTETKVEIVNLVTLQDNNSVRGSFFLGSGNIDGKMKYVYYYEAEGGYKMGQTNYEQALIKYTEDTPRMETIKEIKTNDFSNNFTISLHCSCEDDVVIYIPKGTIKTDYVLDAK